MKTGKASRPKLRHRTDNGRKHDPKGSYGEQIDTEPGRKEQNRTCNRDADRAFDDEEEVKAWPRR
jgi:hypothetical protein